MNNNDILEYAGTGMFSDELDKMGFRNQVISGLSANNTYGKIYGPVRTVLLETMETDDENIAEGLGFFDELCAGEVLCVQGSSEFAYFGELMSRLSVRQKLGGVIIGGLTRDSFYTQTLKELTVLSEGYTPRDIKGRGRVKSTDSIIEIQKVQIKPGDWIFSDKDGVVVIPIACKDELEQRIIKLIQTEGNIIEDINQGITIKEILTKYKEF